MAAKAKAKTTKTAAKKTATKKAATKKAATKKTKTKKAATKKVAAKTSAASKKSPAVKKTPATKKATAATKSSARKKAPVAKKTPAVKKKGSVKKATSPKTKAMSKSSVKKRTVSKTPQRPMVDSAFRNYTPYEPKKSEKYMSEDQLAHFRQILNNWRRELMEEVDRTVHHMQDEAANFPDPADRATQEEEFSIELRTRDRERKLIKKIDQTIDRLDQDDYGYCDTCGIEIGLRRLEARPTATQCVDCKSLDEIKERQIHG
jgi:DnaK suppressor protein